MSTGPITRRLPQHRLPVLLKYGHGGAQGLAGHDQRARRAHPLELGSERRDLAGAERDSFEPCEGELEVRRIDTDGFGSSRIEGRSHGSLSVHPEDQVRSWGRAFG